MKLYEIAQEIEKFVDLASQEDAEVTEKDFDKLEMDFAEKMENTVKYVKNIEAENDAIKAEIKRLQDRKKRNEGRKENLKDYIDHCMSLAGKVKDTFGTFTVSYRKSSSVNIVDENKVPEKYKEVVTETKINKSDIKSDLKLWAIEWVELIENNNLQIK